MGLIRDICEIYRVQGFKTQVLAASIRNPLHVIDAAKAGAHVATMPFAVLQQLIKHPLTDIGLKKFLEDWQKSGGKLWTPCRRPADPHTPPPPPPSPTPSTS